MKKPTLIYRLIIAVLILLGLNGCASYGELQVKCANGDQQACIDKVNRDNAFAGAAMGLQQWNQQQAIQEAADQRAFNQLNQFQQQQALSSIDSSLQRMEMNQQMQQFRENNERNLAKYGY